MDDLKKLQVAVKAGSIVLRAGGEIYRVEEIITNIASSLGLKSVDCFVLPTGLTATGLGEEGNALTIVSSNKEIITDLEKISLVNDLSRRVTSDKLTCDQVDKELDLILNRKPFSLWLNFLATAMVASGFAIMFNGGLKEAFWAFIFGPFVLVAKRLLKVLEVDSFFQNAAGGGISVLISFLLYRAGLITLPNPFIAGMIMILVPGLLITNGFRDTFRGDYVSGVARISEVMVIGAGIGCGAALVYSLLKLL